MHTLPSQLQALVFAGFLLVCAAHAQTPANAAPQHDALFQTIESLDTRLFDAYNHCDLKTFGSLLADDLEFVTTRAASLVGDRQQWMR